MFKKLKLLLETKENLELMNKELINMNFEYEKKIKTLEKMIEENNYLNKIKFNEILEKINEIKNKNIINNKINKKKKQKTKKVKKEEIKEEPKKKGRKKKDVQA